MSTLVLPQEALTHDDLWWFHDHFKVFLKSRPRSQMAERLGNQGINPKVAGSIPGRADDIVSLGKALYPTCLWGNVPLWIRASAKWLNVNVVWAIWQFWGK